MMKRKMIRKLFSLALVLMMAMIAVEASAESAAQDEFKTQRENAIAAMKVSLPDAQLNYAVRDRDDGQYRWNLFFTQGSSLGVCKVNERDNTIRKVELYDKTDKALTADQAVEKLVAEKGAMTITDLDLDWDDGALCYEGEAEQNGRRYEFEMTAAGRIIEWERD